MKPEIKKLWVDALRSGQYKQGKRVLRPAEGCYCCLGVLSDLAVKAGACSDEQAFFNKNLALPNHVLDSAVVEWSGIGHYNPAVLFECDGFQRDLPLAHLNDTREVPFAQLADLIEQQL